VQNRGQPCGFVSLQLGVRGTRVALDWKYHALTTNASKITLVLGRSCLLFIACHWNQGSNADVRLFDGQTLVKL